VVKQTITAANGPGGLRTGDLLVISDGNSEPITVRVLAVEGNTVTVQQVRERRWIWYIVAAVVVIVAAVFALWRL
jgi:hypothetical protein